MGATIKDIAVMANVSTATVSNALTGRRYVSEELCKRIYSAIEALDYHPNTYARSLRTNKSHTIGIQIPDIENPYFGTTVRILQKKAAEKGYNVILYNADNNLDLEYQNIKSMCSSPVDGIVCVAPRLPVQKVIEQVDIPMVIVDRLPVETDNNVAFVYSDNYAGASSAVEYAIGKGYRHFVHLAGPVTLVTNAKERMRGYTETLAQNGIPKEACRIYYGEFTFEAGYESMKNCLDDGLPLDGTAVVFVGNDMAAWGAMEQLKERNIKIPQDVGIVGYDNISFSNFLYPTLTTVENPIERMMLESARLILEAVDADVVLKGITVEVRGKLYVRHSC